MEPLLAEREKNEDEVRELLALCEKLEGLVRNVGMHAGGVLIAPGRLTDFCPLYAAEGAHVISQLDKDDVEAIGLVKFDFLGLTTLTILDWAERYRAAAGRSRTSRSPAFRSTMPRPTSCSPPATRPRCSSWNRAACATSSSARAPTASRT